MPSCVEGRRLGFSRSVRERSVRHISRCLVTCNSLLSGSLGLLDSKVWKRGQCNTHSHCNANNSVKIDPCLILLMAENCSHLMTFSAIC